MVARILGRPPGMMQRLLQAPIPDTEATPWSRATGYQPFLPSLGGTARNKKRLIEQCCRAGGEKDGWETEECSFQQKETKAPDASARRKGEYEGNEMENTDKLETWPRGGGKELEGSGAGR